MLLVDGPAATDVIKCLPLLVREAITHAYRALGVKSGTSNQSSVFVRWPSSPLSKIIAVPAWLGLDSRGISGIKWMASCPQNLHYRLPRVNALIILNDDQAGLPLALIDGSEISLRQTATSGVLAASLIGLSPFKERLGIIGASALTRVVLKETLLAGWNPLSIIAHDLDRIRAVQFASDAKRDLSPGCLLDCANLTDSVQQPVSEGTSLGLDIARGLPLDRVMSIANLLEGEVADRPKPTIFPPFGPSILDLPIAYRVYRVASVGCFDMAWEAL